MPIIYSLSGVGHSVLRSARTAGDNEAFAHKNSSCQN
jgi:hypothetical protein